MRVSLQRMDFERQIFLFPIYKLKKAESKVSETGEKWLQNSVNY